MSKKNIEEHETSQRRQKIAEQLQGQVIAHRGAPRVAPENTLSSFKKASEMGAKWVEFDTQCCGSGEWVIIHDQSLERTTNGEGLVSQTSYKILKNLDAGSWFDTQFNNEPILLLADLLEALQDLNLTPNIEIKFFSFLEENNKRPFKPFYYEEKKRALKILLDIIAKHWSPYLTPPLLSSFDVETLEILKTLAPQLTCGLIVEKISPEALNIADKLDCFSLHCDYENLSNEMLDSLLSQKTKVLLYTINDPLIGKKYLERGVTAIFSDYPNLLSS